MSMENLVPPAPSDPNFAAFPVWLEFSGLPELLTKARRPAWLVFRKLVELDCHHNRTRPGLLEVLPEEVGARCGLDAETVWKCAQVLRRKKSIRAFIEENPAAPLYYEIAAPLQVPREPADIRRDLEDRFGNVVAGAAWRYFRPAEASPMQSEKHRKVVDLYLQFMGTSLNSLLIDELSLLSERFSYDLLEKAFQTAHRKEERSLKWVFVHLKNSAS